VTLAEVRQALDAFAALVEDSDRAEATLRHLAGQPNAPRIGLARSGTARALDDRSHP
jgi:hypothetical protein